MSDEDFVVWMRTSTWSDIFKLHRQVLDLNFSKGMWFNITLDNKFPAWKWNGKKYIVLATSSFIGGGNPSGHALGIVHLVAGTLSAIAGLFFYIKSLTVKDQPNELTREELRQKKLEASMQQELENLDLDEISQAA